MNERPEVVPDGMFYVESVGVMGKIVKRFIPILEHMTPGSDAQQPGECLGKTGFKVRYRVNVESKKPRRKNIPVEMEKMICDKCGKEGVRPDTTSPSYRI